MSESGLPVVEVSGMLEVVRSARPEEGMILRSRVPLAPYPARLGDHLVRWADEAPDRVFLAERGSDGEWRTLTYARALARARGVGQGLLDLGARPERPVMVLSGNSVDHALVQLGALYVGVPVAPISPAYSLVSRDHAKLRHVFGVVRPGVVYVAAQEAFAGALGALDLSDVRLVTSDARPSSGVALDDLADVEPGPAAARAAGRVGPDTVAKILFTSGSTDLPKGVVNTHRMLCANQQQLAQHWPVLEARPPILVDWLPWNHTFGGNHNFNMVLRNGGSLYIDEGKPVPGAFERTLANLRDVSPTVYLNVPKGFAALVPRLEEDEELAALFFRRLDLVFSAAASLPPSLFDRIARSARKHRPEGVAIATGWGATETSPMVTGITTQAAAPGAIGVPAPGVSLKMVPWGDTCELRVKGPNVFPGYHGRDDLTRAAFDADDFYKIGDAGRLLDPQDPSRGIVFDGRLTEDFKLSTGTWVQVGRLRPALLEAAAGLLQDAVVCGHDRDYLAVLAWPDPERSGDPGAGPEAGSGEAGGRDVSGAPPAGDHAVIAAPAMLEAAREALVRYNAAQKGSSTRVERMLLMAEPPDLDAGEITDKGYINQRACLKSRAPLVELLFSEPPGPGVIVA